MDNDTKAHNRALYLAWLRQTAPQLYWDAMRSADNMAVEYDPGAISGFWDSVGSAFQSVATNVAQAVPQLATAYAGYQNQQELIKANTQRAQQGLAPYVMGANGQLTIAQGAGYTDAEWRLAQTGNTTNTLLIAGGLGLLAIILLMRK